MLLPLIVSNGIAEPGTAGGGRRRVKLFVTVSAEVDVAVDEEDVELI